MAGFSSEGSRAEGSNRLYVGTHRRAHRADVADTAFGIYVFEATAAEPLFDPCGMMETLQPGWLAFSPNGRHLYAVNEVRNTDGHAGGAVSAFEIDPRDGLPRLLNQIPLPPMPCHCALDASGKFLLVATFGGGSVHLFGVADDGRIAEECDRHIHSGSSQHPQRQTHPHAHAVEISPDNRFVLVPDLGTDMLMVYRLDALSRRLVSQPDCHVALPPLSGPRHVVFSPDGRHCYLINEMSATITVFSWDAGAGRLELQQSVALLPDAFVGLRSGAAIVIHPDGTRLFATTRSHGSSGMPTQPGLDLLVSFTIDEADGFLTLTDRKDSGGGIPRSAMISPDGNHLYVGHQCSGTIVEFSLESSVPTATGNSWSTPVPVCLAFSPSSA